MADEIHLLEYAKAPNYPQRPAERLRAAPAIAIVVAGLGLAVVGVFILPVLLGQSRCTLQGKAQAMVSRNGPVTNAIELFHHNMGSMPTTLDELLRIDPTDPNRAKWIQGARGAWDLNDPWGRRYQYRVVGDGFEFQYHLWSIGPNGIDESSDGDNDFGDDIWNGG